MATFVRVASRSEMAPGARRRLDVEGYEILLVNVEGNLHAIGFRCPHEGGPLGDGPIAGGRITCPLHRWTFQLDDGSAVTDRRVRARIYPIRVEGEDIYVGI
jgi:nitrite reductase/ring-hydroxylating ferredoxin subunit